MEYKVRAERRQISCPGNGPELHPEDSFEGGPHGPPCHLSSNGLRAPDLSLFARTLLIFFIFPLAAAMVMGLSPLPSHAGNSGIEDWKIIKLVELNSWRGSILFKKDAVETFDLVKPRDGKYYEGWKGEGWYVERYQWEDSDLRLKEGFLSSSPEYDEMWFDLDICDYGNSDKLNVSDYPWGKAIGADRWVKSFWQHDFDGDGVKETIVVSGSDPELSEFNPYTMLYLTLFRLDDEGRYDKREIAMGGSLGISGFFCELRVKDVNSDAVDDILIYTYSSGVSGWGVKAKVYNLTGLPKKKSGDKSARSHAIDKVARFRVIESNILVGEGKVELVRPSGPIIRALDHNVGLKINEFVVNEAKKLRAKYNGEPYFITQFVWKGGESQLGGEFFSAAEEHKRVTETPPSCDRSGKLKIDISRFHWGKIIPARRRVKSYISHDFEGDGKKETVVISSHDGPVSQKTAYQPYDVLTAITRDARGKYRSLEIVLSYPLNFCGLSLMDVNLDGREDIVLVRTYKPTMGEYGFAVEIFNLR